MTQALATTSPLVRRYTIEEFFALEEPPPGTGHYELIAGVLYMVPRPTGTHDRVVSKLNVAFAAYVLAHPGRCELFVPRAAVWTHAATYLEPDLFLMSTERADAAMDDDARTTADLVVEVSSPSSSVYDRTAKADTYAALGVRELWLVDLEHEAIEQRVLVDDGFEVRPARRGDERVESAVFPGLTVVVHDVFSR